MAINSQLYYLLLYNVNFDIVWGIARSMDINPKAGNE